MKIHITNLYGMHFASTALKAQNRTADIATKMLDFKELGIYCYDINSDTHENLSRRLDGIIASVGFGDIVVFQFPTWNGIRFDKAIVERLNAYRDLKKIFFIHDIPPLMFEANRNLLEEHIEFYNQADVLILPTQRMADFLYAKGMTVKKIVIQKMWDFPVIIDQTDVPDFKKVINFSGNLELEKFKFVKEWKYNTVELKVTADQGDWAKGKNISFLGWFNHDISLLTALRRSGGFGLVWSNDSYWKEYMKMNANYKLSAYLAAGIPVIVSNDIAERNTIVRKNLGLAVDSLDEAVSKIEKMDKKQYDDMAASVAVFSNLLRGGFFTRKCLTDAVFQLLYSWDQEERMTERALNMACGNTQCSPDSTNINIMNMQETLQYIKTRRISVARFGDGEIDLMAGHSIPYQDYNKDLAERLKQIMITPDNDKLLVCLPDIFDNRDRYNASCNSFWNRHLEKYQSFYEEVIIRKKCYGSTFFSRPYIDLVDKSISEKHFHDMKELFADKDILIVEGFYSRSGVGNDLFQRAKSVERIICPSRNAYNKYDIILDTIKQYGMNKLILLMLGPTAKVLASDLAFEGYWAVDIGHIDSEYEWYKMGATHKVKFKNKHTAEFNFDEHIELQNDDTYDKEIVAVLSN